MQALLPFWQGYCQDTAVAVPSVYGAVVLGRYRQV